MGREAWNEWAAQVLKSKAQFQEAGVFSLDWFGEAGNDETQLWLNIAAADFSNQHVEDEEGFEGFIFPGPVSLEGTVFERPVSFAGTEFHLPANFAGAHFLADATFKSTKFEDQAIFDDAIFDALADFERAAVEIFQRDSPSVVQIAGQVTGTGEDGRAGVQTGTGFVWDGAGHIVTNNHVVRGASGISVRLSNGEVSRAEVVGTAPNYDLAVLRLQGRADIPPPVPAEFLRCHPANIGAVDFQSP